MWSTSVHIKSLLILILFQLESQQKFFLVKTAEKPEAGAGNQNNGAKPRQPYAHSDDAKSNDFGLDYSDSNESGDDYSASNERDEVDSHHTKDLGTDYMVTSDQAPSSLKYPSKVITTKEI